MLQSDSRAKRGWILIAPYKYAVPLKNGQWTIYEGGWSDSGEDCIAGLTVRRDAFNKPVRFNSFEAASLLIETILEDGAEAPAYKKVTEEILKESPHLGSCPDG